VVAADADGVEMIGNYPQAFSHLGLVNAAWAIAQAEADARLGAEVAPRLDQPHSSQRGEQRFDVVLRPS
jgi:hypothetical protein